MGATNDSPPPRPNSLASRPISASDFISTDQSANGLLVHLHGSWNIVNLPQIARILSSFTLSQAGPMHVDGTQLKQLDTAGAATLLRFLSQAETSLDALQLINFSPAHQSILQLTKAALRDPTPLRAADSLGSLQEIGKNSLDTMHTIGELLDFVGETTLELIEAIRHPLRFRYRELCIQLEAVGYRAIFIVSLVTFLIGVVVAYLSGIQIERYGANIFIVDGVALAMCRELSPILVAIIVAGRSGSAYTAHLGTMKLNEEIDAMTILSLSPMRVLVLPRILALMIAMPLLVFIGDIAGIAGGLVAADLRLGVTATTFLERLQVVLPVRSVLVGLVKAPVFAFFVATIACHLGLQTEANARSVGINTTRTVVQSIVAVILLNAAFAIIFSELKI